MFWLVSPKCNYYEKMILKCYNIRTKNPGFHMNILCSPTKFCGEKTVLLAWKLSFLHRPQKIFSLRNFVGVHIMSRCPPRKFPNIFLKFWKMHFGIGGIYLHGSKWSFDSLSFIRSLLTICIFKHIYSTNNGRGVLALGCICTLYYKYSLNIF
jgi:hypothetical protein